MEDIIGLRASEYVSGRGRFRNDIYIMRYRRFAAGFQKHSDKAKLKPSISIVHEF
jgi:hypothetical protein